MHVRLISSTPDSRTYEVVGEPVRGRNWFLIRHIGKGTYAEVSGANPGERVNLIIEEETDPEIRSRWDAAWPVTKLVALAYPIVLKQLKPR